MTEQKFKVGDKVRWVDPHDPDKGVVSAVKEDMVSVSWSNGLDEEHDADSEYLEFLEPQNDAIHPSHYQLPGGVEVIQISEHLTSNGGQAVQYVARATRLDGKIKGSPVEDLRKAVWFIEREIARLEEAA